MKVKFIISICLVQAIYPISAFAGKLKLPQLPTANGVYNYTVSVDVYNGIKKNSPSLYTDLNNSAYANSKVQYIFPDFVYLNATPADPSPLPNPLPSNVTTCPDPAKAIKFGLVNYIAVPEISPVIYSGVLGGCYPGASVTSYYAGIKPNIKVIPHASYRVDDQSGNDFGTFIFKTYQKVNGPSLVKNIADKVASLVISDPNAFGLAIDNEPAISNNRNKPQAVALAAESAFFGEIAAQLLASGKYLFVYDANSTMKNLWSKYKNTVILEPLYDFGENKNNPDTISSVTTVATTYANNFLQGSSAAPGQPVMFVVPASATATYWEYTTSYNIFINPTLPLATKGITTCSIPANNSIAYLALSGSLLVGKDTIQQFYSLCKNIPNQYNSKMIDYFKATLAAVKLAKDKAVSPTGGSYLGVALYAWRIHDYNDIDGFKGYGGNFVNFNSGVKKLNNKIDNGPADITAPIWRYLNTWVP